jgi:DNA polymerase sigma
MTKHYFAEKHKHKRIVGIDSDRVRKERVLKNMKLQKEKRFITSNQRRVMEREEESCGGSVRDRYASTFSEMLIGISDCWMKDGKENQQKANVVCEAIKDIVLLACRSLRGVEFRDLEVYGSTANQLSLPGSSDVDISLTLLFDEKCENAETLEEVLRALGDACSRSELFEVLDLSTRARVPVLKLRHIETAREVDASLQNPYAIQFYNT